MTPQELLSSGWPWVELPIPFDDRAACAEAEALAGRFVGHRSNGRGWKSLCLHGISETHTKSARQYGYAHEKDAPYVWTEAAGRCPVTVALVKRLPFARLFRVRYMLLEPLDFIAPHADTDRPGFGAINIALNHPPGCHFKVEGQGELPFAPGKVFLFDISKRHSVINLSREPRYHLIVHGVLKLEDEDLVAKACALSPFAR